MNSKDLTLEEKLKLVVGAKPDGTADSWVRTATVENKVRGLSFRDASNGIRHLEGDSYSRAMPTMSVLANTWNKDLAFLQAEVIADDAVERNVDVVLGPGINIKRSPYCGRNFEYLSEDPFLAGTMAREFVFGMQSLGVGVSVKHYCMNNTEFDRNYMSNEVSSRVLHEIYLKPFEMTMEARPWTVMSSYNPVNGVYASENKYLLTEVLRDEFGFDGLIMSDWDAVHQACRGINAGVDLIMPNREIAEKQLKDGVQDGTLDLAELDRATENMKRLVQKCDTRRKTPKYTKEQKHGFAVQIAEEGIVLLKNDGVLPLNKQDKLTVGGTFSKTPPVCGGGSAYVDTDFTQPSLKELLEKDYEVDEWLPVVPFREVYQYTAYKRLYEKAYRSDKVILAVGHEGKDEGEGLDRDTLRLCKDEEMMINNLAEFNENIIVLVYAGSVVDMSAWIDKVKAVVFVGYAGEGVNEAVKKILTGETCPSGKLAETFPLEVGKEFTHEKDGIVDVYSEGVFVGYRYYDKYKKEVAFPFGFGLSYAKFEYSNLKVEKTGETDYTVSYDIQNVSDTDGKEVSEVYVRDVMSMVSRPVKELKGFSKDLIKAGETKHVEVKLDKSAFAYYNEIMRKYHVENGDYEIFVGASSRDLRLKAKLNIELDKTTQQTQIEWCV